MIAFAEKIMPY